MPIDAVTGTLPLAPAGKAGSSLSPGAGSPSDAGGFENSLRSMLSSVDDTAGAANTAVGHMVDGTGDVHEAMVALQNADMALQMTVQVRNKLVQAYQDVMRMPV